MLRKIKNVKLQGFEVSVSNDMIQADDDEKPFKKPKKPKNPS